MRKFAAFLLGFSSFLAACERSPRAQPDGSAAANPSAGSAPAGASEPSKVEFSEVAMGTHVTFVAYTHATCDAPCVQGAITRAFALMQELEKKMSEWRSDSEVSRVNRAAGTPVVVSADTLDVLTRALWAGDVSHGTFDITYAKLGDLWKFGDAAEADPKLPSPAEVAARRRFIDYRRVRLDPSAHTVFVPSGSQIGLGGIAKGYIVDRAARVLRDADVRSFLVQAGGDLYGAGTKPGGAPWVSGIQDPRGPQGRFFATIELTDHAFSTAGDYARAFVKGGKRYHHIIDPRTGFPATASRSVTIWAKDATTADAIDDGVFILGPERGLALVESLDGVGAVIVDAKNRVWISKRLQGRVRVREPPTDGL